MIIVLVSIFLKFDSGIIVQNVWTSEFLKCKFSQQSLKLLSDIFQFGDELLLLPCFLQVLHFLLL